MPNDLAPIAPMNLVNKLMERTDFSTEMLRDMLEMVKEQEHRASLRVFKAAFARCQARVTKADADKPNPLFKSRYASITAMYDAVWPAVMAEGFSWTVSALGKPPEGWDNSMLWFQGRLSMDVVTETVELPVPRAALIPERSGNRSVMTPMQSVGALTTYMRKYLLGLMFGVVTEDDVKVDDDGNGKKKTPTGHDPRDDDKVVAPDKWDVWLDKLEAEASSVPVEDTAAWDKLWARDTVVNGGNQLRGDQLARFQTIQSEQSKRVFPGFEEEVTL